MKKVTKYQLPVVGLLLWAMSFTVHAQSSDTLKMTLQQCIDYALKNNITLMNSSIDEELAKAKVGEIRATGLPQITGQIAGQYNARLRDSYFMASGTNPFTSPYINGDPTKGIPANPSLEGKIIKYPNFFQLPNSLDASFTVSQIIFNSSYVVGLQAAKTYKELAARNTQLTKIQISNNVTKAYYLALINLERMNLFDSNILRVDSTLSFTRKMQQNGFVEKVDVMRLEVTLNNLITEREKFINVMLLSNILLKYQMGMSIDKNLLLMDKLADLKIQTTSLENKADYNSRVEYTQLKVNRRLQELDLKNNRWAYMPSLVASANFGTFTSNTDFNFFSTQNFFPGYNGGWNTPSTLGAGGSGIWSKYGLVSLAMQIPIFDGFSKSYKIQQSKLNVKKVDNNIKNLENSIDLQVQQSVILLQNNVKTMETQKRNMELAQEVINVIQKKYKAGVASNLEMTTAETSLKEALINYYNSLYDALVARIDYDQATGNNVIK